MKLKGPKKNMGQMLEFLSCRDVDVDVDANLQQQTTN